MKNGKCSTFRNSYIFCSHHFGQFLQTMSQIIWIFLSSLKAIFTRRKNCWLSAIFGHYFETLAFPQHFVGRKALVQHAVLLFLTSFYLFSKCQMEKFVTDQLDADNGTVNKSSGQSTPDARRRAKTSTISKRVATPVVSARQTTPLKRRLLPPDCSGNENAACKQGFNRIDALRNSVLGPNSSISPSASADWSNSKLSSTLPVLSYDGFIAVLLLLCFLLP